MAAGWYKWRRRGVRGLLVAFLLYLTFLVASAFTATATITAPRGITTSSTAPGTSSRERLYIVEHTQQAVMARIGAMKSTFFALASSALVAGQNTTSGTPTTGSEITATVDGVATTFSNAFTVPASADIGPNLLPNIKDPQAVQAQDVCPGYMASDVEKTSSGFTAMLSLAGEPVSIFPAVCIIVTHPLDQMVPLGSLQGNI